MGPCKTCGSPWRTNPCFWALDNPLQVKAGRVAPCRLDMEAEEHAARVAEARLWLCVAVLLTIAGALLAVAGFRLFPFPWLATFF